MRKLLRELFLVLQVFWWTCKIQASAYTNNSEIPGHLASRANETLLSAEEYEKCLSFMRRSQRFNNYTTKEIVNYLDEAISFQGPEDLVKRLPYYLAGYDFEGKPVWMAEFGKFKLYDLIETFIENFSTYEKLAAQAAIRVVKSMVASEKKNPDREISQFVGFLDLEGFELKLMFKMLAHPGVIAYGLKAIELHMDIGEKAVGQLFVININHAAKILVELVSPVAGQLMERVVLLGTNKSKWRAVLRRYFPDQTIPTWYGGPANYTPVAVFG